MHTSFKTSMFLFPLVRSSHFMGELFRFSKWHLLLCLHLLNKSSQEKLHFLKDSQGSWEMTLDFYSYYKQIWDVEKVFWALEIECSIILPTDLVQGQRFHTRCQEFQKIDIHKSQMQISSSKIGHVITQSYDVLFQI